MPKIGEKAPSTGRYQSNCVHKEIIHIKQGETLPPCPKDKVPRSELNLIWTYLGP